MGKLAGFWKKIKQGVSKGLDFLGNSLNKIAKSNILRYIPKGLGIPIDNITEKIGTTLNKFSENALY